MYVREFKRSLFLRKEFVFLFRTLSRVTVWGTLTVFVTDVCCVFYDVIPFLLYRRKVYK